MFRFEREESYAGACSAAARTSSMAAVNSFDPGARDDDRVSPAVRFLGDAKESSAIVFAEFDVEMFPLDLDLLRFDNVVHVEAGVCRLSGFVEAKNSLISRPKRVIFDPDFLSGGVCAVTDPGWV